MQQALSANRAGTMFDVCERLVPPQAVVVHTIPDSFSRRHERLSGVAGGKENPFYCLPFGQAEASIY